MKKLIGVVIILFACINVYARESGPGFYAEYGTDTITKTSYTEINIHYTWKPFGIELSPYGVQKTWFNRTSKWDIGIEGKPFCDIYTVGFEIKYEGVSFAVEHFCAHKVLCGDDYMGNAAPECRVDANGNLFKIRYTWN